MQVIIQGLLVLCCLFQACYCHSSGAPTSVCDTMVPGHDVLPQSSPSPYSIKATLENGQAKVNVNGADFKGVLIEARDAADVTKIIDGTFSFDSSLPLKTLNCDSGTENAVTHSNPTLKNEIAVMWSPPNTFSGRAMFRATVVKAFSEFWTNHDSESLEFSATGTASPPTTTPASNALYEGCGVSYGCHGYPDNCIESKSCQMMTKFITEDGSTEFDLVRFSATSESYVALGFSKDNEMGDDSVVACVHFDGSTHIKTGWNTPSPDLGNELKPINYGGFSAVKSSFEDGILKCTFKQPNSWKMEAFDFKLNETTYLLLALGTASSASELNYHDEYGPSSNAIDTLAFTKANTDEIESIYDNCGETKGCYAEPSNCIESKNCLAFVSFAPHAEGVEFHVTGKSNGYVAVGLSLDNKMGEDSVTSCLMENNIVQVKQAWNVAKPSKFSNILSDPKVGLTQNSGTYNDGTISCQFIREIKTSINGNTFDLNSTDYFLLLAIGPVSDSKMSIHNNRWASASALMLTSASVVKGDQNLMVKIHGMLMIMAWIGTASIGMLFARYFKSVWSTSTITGVKVWFFYHRVFMVLTFILTVAAFVLIFVDVQGLSQVGKNPHPYLGIATTALCVLQPFIALCRCAPDDTKRPIFNWMHWFIGNSAQILGVVTIFFAVELAKTNLPQYFDWILVAFIIFHILFHIILQAMACKNDGKSKKVSDIHMSSYGSGADNAGSFSEPKNTEVKGASGRVLTLIIYVFFNIGFIAALVAIVWIS